MFSFEYSLINTLTDMPSLFFNWKQIGRLVGRQGREEARISSEWDKILTGDRNVNDLIRTHN